MAKRPCFFCKKCLPEADSSHITFVYLRALGSQEPCCMSCAIQKQYKIVRLEKP